MATDRSGAEEREMAESVLRARERLMRRLPGHLSRGRVVGALLDSFAVGFGRLERSLRRLTWSRWVDVCEGGDLDHIASLFLMRRAPNEGDEAFRRRILLTIREVLAGTGTIGSLENIIMATLGVRPEIVENPPMRRVVSIRVPTGGEFKIRNMGLGMDRVAIRLVPLINLKDVKVTCVTSGASVRFDHTLRESDVLVLMPDGKAVLNGEDASEHMHPGETPRMPRGESMWRYSDGHGRFDHSRFDESVFAGAKGNVVEIQVSWEEETPATVRISLPLELTREDQIYLQREMRKLAGQVKTAGVAQLVNFYDTLEEVHPLQRDAVMGINASRAVTEHVRMSDSMSAGLRFDLRESHGMADEVIFGGRFDESTFDDVYARFV